MEHRSSLRKRMTAVASVVALTLTGLLVSTVVAPFASAAPGPIAQPDSSVVTADALPTVQVDGVVWSQAVVGNTVYAGGKFSNARPAGAAAGTQLTPRANLLAYNITTGNLITSFAPSLNGQVRAVAASPDGKRVYVAGDFTTANGVAKGRIAAYDTATGQLITSFAGAADYFVYALAATNTAVYAAGDFNNARGVARGKFAAFRASDGALLGWNPAADAKVQALVITPDGSKVIAGGAFQNVSGTPAYGMAALDATSGAVLPWAATNLVRNAGSKAAILGLTTDGTSIFGNGYVFGAGGNLEGAFSADPNTGVINWVEDCHGDTYANYPAAGALYTVSHAHYCGNVGGAPQTSPNWTFQHAMAFTKNVTGTLNADPYGYYNYAGTPSPSIINWFPDLAIGSFTGQSQAAWSVTGNSNYVVLGGEFPRVNGLGQQGLVRFAVKPIAPAKQGPIVSGANLVPNLISLAAGTVRVAFQANYDRDDTTLTYDLLRDGKVVQTQTANSTSWNRPSLGFIESGLTAGTQYKYQIRVTDSSGNIATGSPATITPAGTGGTSAYAQLVKSQGASTFWRLGEASGSAVYDWAQFTDATAGNGVGRGAAGAVNGDTNTAATFNGTVDGRVVSNSAMTAPDTFTTATWFKTTTTSGGKILGFGNSATGDSSSYDRHIYMDNSGKLIFGVYRGGVATVNSAKAYNDGQWHQVVASLGANGMTMFVDGVRVGQRSDVTQGQAFTGYWKVGGDNLGGWPNKPASNSFNGTIDDVSIYPKVLTGAQAIDQYVASGRVSPIPPVPADAYGAAVYNDQPDLFYRLDESTGSVATDSSAAMNPGSYLGGSTKGQAGAVTGTTDTAVLFDGTSGFVASGNQIPGPTTYSEEAWFKTTTTQGGKIVGFGTNATGLSNGYDRHVYLQDNGKLVFGVWTGKTNTITTPTAYNNGQWHHVVATQSGDGMKLYVDGQLAGTNPQTGADNTTGYWKIGGDVTWGSSSNYFAGTIDEVAVYPTALSADRVLAHYTAGGGQPPNVNPVAGFTSSTSALTASVDARTSTDSDGTIASYAWNFGDGGTATGATASHSYITAGTYQVQLTVTDNRGGTNVITHPVIVAPNQLPVAAFTVTSNNLGLAVDGSTSSDPDGTIASYDWNFGDGATANGATATHTFGAAGTFQVSLTITDNSGGIATLSQPVTATAPPVNEAPVAAFVATTDGLTATVDGSTSTDTDGTVVSYDWNFGDGSTGTGSTASRTYAEGGTYSVTLTVTDDNGATTTLAKSVAVTAPAVPNVAPVAAFTSTPDHLKVGFDATASTDSDGTVASYAWDFGDGASGSGVKPSHTYTAGGTFQVSLTVTDNDGATNETHSPVVVTPAPPGNVAPVAAFTSTTTNLNVSVDAATSDDPDGSIVTYAWDFGDGATASGVTASHKYLAPGTHQVTLTVTDDKGTATSITKPVETQRAPNQAPVAAFTTTTVDLTAALDAGTSADPDGTIATYAWDFGDGATGSGVTATHAYTAGGTFQVKLTVTDNLGTATSVINPVTVASAPAAVFGSDQFARTIASGWGTADQGGAWTLAGTTTNFSVGSGTGKIKMASAGAGPAAWLSGVSQPNVDITVDVSMDKVASGGGTYISVAARHVGTSDYRLKVRALAGGAVSQQLVRVVKGVETVLSTQTVAGINYAAGDALRLRFVVNGTGTATLQSKVWKVGSIEPAWQVSQTDSTAALRAAGEAGLVTYLSGSSTTAPVTAAFDNLTVTAVK